MLALIEATHTGAGAHTPFIPIAIFIGIMLSLLALDLGVLNRKAHVIKAGEAMLWTAFWVTLALLFGGVVYLAYENHWFGLGLGATHAPTGRDALVEYVTGYLVEQSLSLDNIFVIATIFAYFRVPGQFQHRVLFWGIIGVIVMRGAMIAGGAALIHAFDWSVYIFGAILFFSAIKMLALDTENIDIEASLAVRVGRKLFPIHSEYVGQKFFTRVDGKRFATPLFLVLLLVETADAVFALDSIPAIFAITTDPFIVFTSNVFAIMGLRSLYFALAAIVHKFKYLKYSLAFLLAYVGVKMVLTHHYKIEPAVSLAIIGGILALGIIASLVSDKQGAGAPKAGEAPAPGAGATPRLAPRQVRSLVLLVIGTTAIALVLVLVSGMGPLAIVLPVGLAVLAAEVVWALAMRRKYRRSPRELPGHPAAEHAAPPTPGDGPTAAG